jgi:hypothetical protein
MEVYRRLTANSFEKCSFLNNVYGHLPELASKRCPYSYLALALYLIENQALGHV